MSESQPTYKNPLLWVSTSYLAMGLIYTSVSAVANIMFSNLGMSNAEAAAWSSAFVFPYVIKPLWAPLIEIYKTKKFFVILMQFLLSALVFGTALALRLPGDTWIMPVLVLLGLSGFLGATQDIASDGVYVTTLSPKEQARFSGIQGFFWQGGPVVASGLLVWVSGKLNDRWHDWGASWMAIFAVIAGLMAVLGAYHLRMLPSGAKADDAPETVREAMSTYVEAFASFFKKKDILLMILMAFFFRFGYGFVEKIGPLFMLGDVATGGLGLNNQLVGKINGVVGTSAFMAGSVLGGLIVAKLGLKRMLLFLCLCMNVPNVVFVYLSQTQTSSIPVVAALVGIDKFFWGIGAVGLIVYMMQQVSPGRFRTAHYTFATAIMGLNMMLTGVVSGKLQEMLGYKAFFLFVLAGAIPSLLVTILAPFHNPESGTEAAPAAS